MAQAFLPSSFTYSSLPIHKEWEASLALPAAKRAALERQAAECGRNGQGGSGMTRRCRSSDVGANKGAGEAGPSEGRGAQRNDRMADGTYREARQWTRHEGQRLATRRGGWQRRMERGDLPLLIKYGHRMPPPRTNQRFSIVASPTRTMRRLSTRPALQDTTNVSSGTRLKRKALPTPPTRSPTTGRLNQSAHSRRRPTCRVQSPSTVRRATTWRPPR